jgi:cell pole-organizing protein PopZ
VVAKRFGDLDFAVCKTRGPRAMNAPNPSTAAEGDALRRAQRAHEPSMEEILASIRSIIADERTAPPKPPAPLSGPQIVYSNDQSPSARAVPPPPPAEEVPPAAASAPKVVWEKPEVEATAPKAAEPEPADDETPLLSDETNEQVASSFSALSASMAMQNTQMVEALMREMLRPMLKSWLDDNLPSLVERLVRAEIQRAARGGR